MQRVCRGILRLHGPVIGTLHPRGTSLGNSASLYSNGARRCSSNASLRCWSSSRSLELAPRPSGTVAEGAAAPPTEDSEAASITFQDAVTRLQSFWADEGCAMWLPHNTEVGAGTMNPSTFLRVLGPEPWSVAYVEPSIRPDDSRYGLNPNRVQRHTQFQVILKPDPGNAQDLYLASLRALGVDTQQHDVRFVEDNWESPVLGAWGLGWEVWLNGMEVTQFTYFQQAGGKVLEVPSVEITYGLERIIMAIQGVKHFKDIQYSQHLTYGEMFLQNEWEMSKYNLEEASISDHQTRFRLYEEEAKRMLALRLPIPAYDCLLKLSHTFNVLDARGAVGVTERANSFAALRSLARQTTELWSERREEQGHPLGNALLDCKASTVVDLGQPPAHSPPTGPAPFLLEIGCEELPPADLQHALTQLRQGIPQLLKACRLSHGAVTVAGTPRRLVVNIADLAPQQSAASERIRGPPAKVAFAPDGSPTPALLGFCRKNRIEVKDTVLEADANGADYVWCALEHSQAAAWQALAQRLPDLLSGLSFQKSMRWLPGVPSFSRPVRWLLSMHAGTVVPLSFAGVESGDQTRLLRSEASPVKLASASEHGAVLLDAGILVDVAERRASIWEACQSAAASINGSIPEATTHDLLEEVADLVESPTVILGSFDPEFLGLPQEVLVMVMRKHQRYFPVVDPQTNGLLPHFITVANGAVNVDLVRAGNEAVLRARFEDARFFYEADTKKSLEQHREKLESMTFQQDLGSLLDRCKRVFSLVEPLTLACGFDKDTEAVAGEAASLYNADLGTSMVTEMTALAGVMGRHYAEVEGRSSAVATAMYEGILPRFSGDALPSTPAGVLVSLADKLDAIVGLFAAGCAPTGNSDPYALRRAAVGLLGILLQQGVHMDLPALVALASAQLPVPVTPEVRAGVLDFITRRLEQLLLDEGLQPEAVRAALGARAHDPVLAAATARELAAGLAAGPDGALGRVLGATTRAARLVRSQAAAGPAEVRPDLFQQAEEGALHGALQAAEEGVAPDASLAGFVEACAPLVGPLNAFLDGVFVMTEDEGVRGNRLALLRRVAQLPGPFLSVQEVQGLLG
uniref:glycine--tRNA ligase n=1 Tax=Auxenochlorella protothecoides TaxID=3075 RepID=A0A1D1ZWJ6_AUXPR